MLLALSAAALVTSVPARAACPKVTVTVDNDTAGSGYSEESANWQSWSTNACKGTYRYLSKHIGDGTSKGKAIWKPKITVAGTYAVKTGWRGSANRTDSADYTLIGDDGATTHKVVDQHVGDACTMTSMGTAKCTPGGNCRLELVGNDGESACADVTTFELVACDDPTSPPNAQPTGALEAASCDAGVTGWATDPDDGASAIEVHLYFDGPVGQSTLGLSTTANLARPDLCAGCSRGFALPIPVALRDKSPHTVHAYGIDLAGGTNPLLGGSPRTFTCDPVTKPAPAAEPSGALESASCSGVKGWALDAAKTAAAASVYVSFDGAPGAPGSSGQIVVADRARPDLCATLGTCDHGFEVPLPTKLVDGVTHQVYASAVLASGELGAPLAGSPRAVVCAAGAGAAGAAGSGGLGTAGFPGAMAGGPATAGFPGGAKAGAPAAPGATTAEGGDDGGCGCRVPGGRASGAVTAALALALALWRRRR